ncbi:MAG: hypothetical protein VKL39_12195, partial [Leptolyngbyaceae bacterium]|nr:hypothetical protein [Leptolyngbyaceae bacterium]
MLSTLKRAVDLLNQSLSSPSQERHSDRLCMSAIAPFQFGKEGLLQPWLYGQGIGVTLLLVPYRPVREIQPRVLSKT